MKISSQKMKTAAAVLLTGFAASSFYACNEVGNGKSPAGGLLNSGGDVSASYFKDQVLPIFAAHNCASCHGSSPPSQTVNSNNVGLSLTPGNAYASLITATGTGEPTGEARTTP